MQFNLFLLFIYMLDCFVKLYHYTFNVLEMIKISFLTYINTVTFIVVNSFVTFSQAIEPDELLVRIEKQEKVILEQRKRIEKLEEVLNKIIDSRNLEESNIIIKENNRVSKNEDILVDQDIQDENVGNKDGQVDQGVLSTKVYNPETAFFGPLPRLKTNDGFFSISEDSLKSINNISLFL